MSDRYKVETVELNEGTYHEVHMYNGHRYVPMYQNNKRLRFRIKKMAEMKISSLLRAFCI